MRRLVASLLILSSLGACTGVAEVPATATAVPTMAPTFTPEPECSADVEPDFKGYPTWTKVNPKPIQGHETFVNIYVDDAAKDIYLSASGRTFPVCSRVVKTHLVGAEDETITAVTVMVKMPTGFDPEHNDWWWGMYDKDGEVAEMSGKVAVCIACHQPVVDADYVFSKKVMEEIK